METDALARSANSASVSTLPPPRFFRRSCWIRSRALRAVITTSKHSQAFGVNDLGQVVGVSNLQGDNLAHAFLYQDGGMTDLNGLIPAGSGWVLSEALAINE